jgi:hypothetical protein
LDPDSAAYNITAAVRLEGNLNVAALEGSLFEEVRRHEVLRTTFSMKDDQPLQVVGSEFSVSFAIVNLEDLPVSKRVPVANRVSGQEARRPFDLGRGPLLRAILFRLSYREHLALYVMHHIISDGASCRILIREIAQLYNSFVKNEPSPLAELAIQYADFAIWQRASLESDVLDEQLLYWKNQLAGAPPLLNLPIDRPRPELQTAQGGVLPIAFPPGFSSDLTACSRKEATTLFILLLTGFQVLLHYYTEQDDIVVGTDVSKRNCPETEALIGFFVNQLVIRTSLGGDPDFRTLLRRTRSVALAAYTKQDLPFEKLVERLKLERSLNHPPIFQVKVVLQHARRAPASLAGLVSAPMEVNSGTSQLDLILHMIDTEDGLTGALEYNADLFRCSTVAKMLDGFTLVLRSVVSKPTIRLSALKELLAGAERQDQLRRVQQLREASLEALRAARLNALERAQLNRRGT